MTDDEEIARIRRETLPARLHIVPKSQLTPEQSASIAPRIAVSESASEAGPRDFWNLEGWQDNYYAVFESLTGKFVGIVYCVVRPPDVFDVAWWIDAEERSKGYGRQLADDLAAYLKSRRVCRVGTIRFRGSHEAASMQIARRFKSHFRVE